MGQTRVTLGKLWFRTVGGVVAGVVLGLGAAVPASAEEVVIDYTANQSAICGSSFTPFGQTFTAMATGDITTIGLASYGPAARTTTLTVRAGGAIGAVLGSQEVTFAEAPGFPAPVNDFTLDTPIAVVEGGVYAFEIADGTCLPYPEWKRDFMFGISSSPYAGGAAYNSEGVAQVFDFAFRVVIDTDSDADGVVDAADVCPGTTFTAGPAKLLPNHYWSTSEGFVNSKGVVAYTLAETGGCSAEQIIVEAGLGAGHTKWGISVDALKAWIASLPS